MSLPVFVPQGSLHLISWSWLIPSSLGLKDDPENTSDCVRTEESSNLILPLFCLRSCFQQDWTRCSTDHLFFFFFFDKESVRMEKMGRHVQNLTTLWVSLLMDGIAFWPQPSFLLFPRLIFYAAAECRLGKQNESFKQICTWIKERVISLVQSADQFG